MTLNREKSFLFLLFVLYFLQGLPYGLQVKFLPVLLRSQSFSLSSVSFIRLLSIPWLCKALWAPLVDRSKSLATWLMSTMLGTGTVFICLSIVDFTQVNSLIVAVFALNILTALQDIAVDLLAISLLKASELGHGNIAQVVGYKIGALMGGGALVWLHAWLSWGYIFAFVSCLYFLAVVLIQFSSVKGMTTLIPNKDMTRVTRSQDVDNYVLDCLMTFSEIFKVPWTPQIAIYVFIYKLGEQGLVSMFPLSLVDNGMSLEHVSVVTGIFGQLFSISGSVIGGLLISKYRSGITTVLLVWSTLRLFPMALQLVIVYLDFKNLVVIAISECLLQLCAGVVTTATFTMMMMCSQLGPPNIHGSHYSVLATIEVLGKLFMTSASGVIVDNIGYPNFFIVCLLLSLGVVILMKTVKYDLRSYHMKQKIT